MRIGIDLMTLSSPSTAFRGIGAYVRGFLQAIIKSNKAHEFILYQRGTAHQPDLVEDENAFNVDKFICENPNVKLARYDENPKAKITSINALASNPDNLDWLILTSPHESHMNKKLKNGRLASIVYDTIPDRFPETYLDVPMQVYANDYTNYHEAVRRYDRILAISESTAKDLVHFRDYNKESIRVISCGRDPHFTPRAANFVYPKWIKELTHERPFLLHVGGTDDRKGGRELLQAFQMLEQRIRTRFQLIYAYNVDAGYRFGLQKDATLMGVSSNFHLLGYVSNKKLVELYQNAYLSIFPSKAEGFGLPILESLACGTPVIAGNNTSQPEALGSAGLTVDAANPEAISKAINLLIDDPSLHGRIKRHAVVQAEKFTWENTARLAMEALETHTVTSTKGETTEKKVISTSKPRLAFFGLIGSDMSGVTPYCMNLADALSDHYEVTYYCNPSTPKELFGKTLFSELKVTFETAAKYDGTIRILHQFGNSCYHQWQVDMILRKGGVVTMHDVSLSGLHQWMQANTVEIPERMDCGSFALAIQRAAKSIVVHSFYARNMIDKTNVYVIPFGANLNNKNKEQVDKIREKTKLPRAGITTNELVLMGTGGFIHDTKLGKVVLSAYIIARQALERKGKHLALAVIGEEFDGGILREQTNLWRASDVYLTGKLGFHDFANAIAALDMYIGLRKTPTNGETSSSLVDALRAGIPTIVSGVGSFQEFPDQVAQKIYHGDDLAGRLATDIIELACDDKKKQVMSENAQEWIVDFCSWEQVAKEYKEIIEASI